MTDPSITRSRLSRAIVLFVALGYFFYLAGDLVDDLQTWHGATTPQVVGGLLKDAGKAMLFALTGNVFKTPGVLRRLLDGSDEPAHESVEKV